MSAGLLGSLPDRTASRSIRCTVIATFSTLFADVEVALHADGDDDDRTIPCGNG